MKLRNVIASIAVAGTLATMSLIPANAITFQFASFAFDGPAQPSYSNTTGGITAVSVPIIFSYTQSGLSFVPVPGLGGINATLTLTSTPGGNVAPGGFGSLGQVQNISSFSITSNNSFLVNGLAKNNLLSGSATNLVLSGSAGGSTAGLNGSQTSVSNPAVISYLSDFLLFPVPPVDADITFAFNGLQSSPGGLTQGGNNFNSFVASIQGGFGYNPSPRNVVPEPGAVAMFAGMGVSASLFALKLRKRRK